MPRVVGDDAAGGALAARHLLELGHTAIGFVGDALHDPFGFTSSHDREQGLTDELAHAGISIPDRWIGHGAHGRYEARDLARQMLTADQRPTAIFTASDTQALGVIAAARELGLHVPDDLSVIGYDDVEAADYVGLTTVRQQLFESGRRGAEVLLAEIGSRSEEPHGRSSGTGAGGPRDHGAAEGGPWMRTPDELGTRKEHPRGGVLMISIGIGRAGAALAGRAPRGARCRRHPGGGLRRARGRRDAVACSDRGADGGRAIGEQRSKRRSPVSECRGRRSVVRNRPRRAERLLRDRLRPAVQALGRIHQAVPERDLEDQPGPVHEPHDRDAAAAVGRQSPRPDPAAVDGLDW